MNQDICEKTLENANVVVDQIFARNGLRFTEYNNRQANIDLNDFSFDKEWSSKELAALFLSDIFKPRKAITVNGIYAHSVDKTYLPTEVQTSGLFKKVVGAVSASKPFPGLEHMALSHVTVYSGISNSNYAKLQQACASASEIYSLALGKDWNISIKKL